MSIFDKLSSNPIIRLSVAVFASLFLLGLGLNLPEVRNGSELIAQTIYGNEINIPWILCLLFDMICIAAIMQLVSRINSTHRFVDGSMFSLRAFIFIGLVTWPKILLYPEIIFSSLLSIVVLLLLLQIYQQGHIFGFVFGAAFLASLATLFYSPFLVLLPLIFIGVSIFRPFGIRIFLFGLMGYGLLFFYLSGISYLINWPLEMDTSSDQLQKLSAFNFILSWRHISAIGFIGISLLAVWKMYGLRQTLIVRQRNQLSIVLMFLISFMVLAILYGVSKMIILLLVPLSISFLFYFHNVKRKWVVEVLLLFIFAYNTWLSFFI